MTRTVPVTKSRLWNMSATDLWDAGRKVGVPTDGAVSLTVGMNPWRLVFEWKTA